MAKRIQAYSYRYLGLGKRHLGIVWKLLLIVLLAFQPGWASGGSGKGSGSGGGGGCSGGGGSGGSGGGGPDLNQVSQEMADTYGSLTNPEDIAAIGLTESIDGDAFITGLLNGASNRRDPRLPGYSYFQGVIHADNHVTVAGQVRIVGGVIGVKQPSATANLYNGAMVTSNAHAFLGAGNNLIGGPPGMRTRIKTLEEVPNP